MDEITAIKQRYAKRSGSIPADKYLMTNRHVLMGAQERERKIVRFLNGSHLTPLRDKKILEVGCGSGSNLIDLIRWGALPQNLTGNDLLEGRLRDARERLPGGVTLIGGDASELALVPGSFDLVLQSTVFTSILDDGVQTRVADKMWTLLRPGGFILWYDFVHKNPRNRDVRAVGVKRIRELFPGAKITVKRATLFPFLSKAVTGRFYFPYTLLNLFPFLRMHALCMIEKPV